MRSGLFQKHLYQHHEDFERGLLILYMLVLAIVLAWLVWRLPIFQSSGIAVKPEPTQLWWY